LLEEALLREEHAGDETMAHFWFHVRHAEGKLLDEEGMDLPNLRAVCEEVRRSSQELLSEDLDLIDVRFEVTDVTGRIVVSLPVNIASATRAAA
jgi:hypothetical protein